MSKLEKALHYARKQLEHFCPYVWGGQGEKLKKLTALKLAAMEDSVENAGRVMKFIKANLKKFTKYSRIFDCSGFVICCLIYAKVLPKGYDVRACDLQAKWPKIAKAARKAGDLVYRIDSNGKAYHVGILLNADTVAECKGRDYGLISAPWDPDRWQEVNRPNYE